MEDNNFVKSNISGYGLVFKSVMKDTNLSIEAKALHSYLSAYAGSDGAAFPSVKLICHELNVSERRFKKYRKELESYGYLKVERKRQEVGFSKNIYYISTNPVSYQFVPLQSVPLQSVPLQNVGTTINSNTINSNTSNSDNKGDLPKSQNSKGTKKEPLPKSNGSKNVENVYEEIISYLNQKARKSFKPTSKATQKLINGRIDDGYTLKDFKHVIDVKTAEWLHDDYMNQFLAPSTLFRPTKFEKYVNENIEMKVNINNKKHISKSEKISSDDLDQLFGGY